MDLDFWRFLRSLFRRRPPEPLITRHMAAEKALEDWASVTKPPAVATVPTFRIRGGQVLGVREVSSPNKSDYFLPPPDTILLHYTAGPSLESAVNTFRDPSRRVSAHLIVDRDGTVVQCVPLYLVAWHAGRSEWQGRPRVNDYSIGIEMVNAGRLDKVGISELRSWWGGLYLDPRTDALHSGGVWWHRYTDEQIATVEALCRSLLTAYPIRHILGHEEVARPLGRKSDPGPAFPLEELRNKLFSDGPFKT